MQIVTWLATFSVTRRVRDVLNRIPDDEMDNAPDELQVEPIRELVAWAIDAAGALGAIAAPAFGLIIVLPQSANTWVAVGYMITLITGLGVFLFVLFVDNPSEYTTLFFRWRLSRLRPITLVPMVAIVANVSALALALKYGG